MYRIILLRKVSTASYLTTSEIPLQVPVTHHQQMGGDCISLPLSFQTAEKSVMLIEKLALILLELVY